MFASINMQREYFIKTKRLGLSTWKSEDIRLALSLWSDHAVTQYITSDGMTREMIQNRLDFEISHREEYSVQYFPIFLLENGDFIGCCGLRAFDSTPGDLEEGTYELGFHLKKESWGKGYAREAAERMIDYGFHTLHLKNIFAGHHPDNIASARLLNRLGFIPTGYHFYPPTGLDHPCYLLKNKIQDK